MARLSGCAAWGVPLLFAYAIMPGGYTVEIILIQRHDESTLIRRCFNLFPSIVWVWHANMTAKINFSAKVGKEYVQFGNGKQFICAPLKKCSWLSLSRTRLSRITAYLEVKIWSLPKHENLITCKKNIVEKRRNCSLGAISPLFHNILTYLSSYITHIFVKCDNRISFSLILQIWYVQVRISRSISESPLEFEIMRVDCSYMYLPCLYFSQHPTKTSRKHAYIISTPLNPTFI